MSALEIQALGHQSLFTVIEEVAVCRWFSGPSISNVTLLTYFPNCIFSAIALTILIYDTLLTLGDEVCVPPFPSGIYGSHMAIS
jgi:hypothetical protein